MSTYDQWFAKLEAIGVKERFFDPPDIKFLCPGTHPRRPYKGKDGFFFECFESGMSPTQALGEIGIEQDGI